jgi:hypothetical protein
LNSGAAKPTRRSSRGYRRGACGRAVEIEPARRRSRWM